MYKKLLIALAAVGAVVASIPADARHRHHGGRTSVVITVGSPGYYYHQAPVRYYDPYYRPVYYQPVYYDPYYYPRYRTYYRPHYRYRHYDRPRHYRKHYRHHHRRHYNRW
jgi:hypothetical protein